MMVVLYGHLGWHGLLYGWFVLSYWLSIVLSAAGLRSAGLNRIKLGQALVRREWNSLGLGGLLWYGYWNEWIWFEIDWCWYRNYSLIYKQTLGKPSDAHAEWLINLSTDPGTGRRGNCLHTYPMIPSGSQTPWKSLVHRQPWVLIKEIKQGHQWPTSHPSLDHDRNIVPTLYFMILPFGVGIESYRYLDPLVTHGFTHGWFFALIPKQLDEW